MKKIILFLMPIFLLGVYGYMETTSESSNPPRIIVEPEIYDFGKISMTDVVYHDFKITNKGSGELKIKRIATSCGCARAEVKERLIPPQRSTRLRVTYEPALMSSHIEGEEERIIYIQTNDPQNSQVEVIIKAVVN